MNGRDRKVRSESDSAADRREAWVLFLAWFGHLVAIVMKRESSWMDGWMERSLLTIQQKARSPAIETRRRKRLPARKAPPKKLNP